MSRRKSAENVGAGNITKGEERLENHDLESSTNVSAERCGETIDATGGEESRALVLLCETYHDLYWQSCNLLAKTWAFYLAITAVLAGYVLTEGLAPNLPPILLVGGVIVSVSTIISFTTWFWGLRLVVLVLERITKRLNSALFIEVGLEPVFKNWKGLLVLVALGTIATGLFILCSLIALLVGGGAP